MNPLFQQAVQYFQLGQLNAANAALLQVSSTDPMNHGALHLLGIIASQQGKHKQAISYIEKAINLCDKPAQYIENLGNVHQLLSDWPKAKSAWCAALELNGNSADIMYKLGLASMSEKDKEQAEKWWVSAIEINPKHSDALVNLGMLKAESDNHRLAMSYWKKASAISPNDTRLIKLMTDAQIAHGKEALINGKYKLAEKELKEACKRSPKSSEGWGLLADAFLKLGHAKKSFDACKRAVVLEPENPKYHHNMGNIFRSTGQLNSALEAYERALRLGSSHPATLQAIATLKGDDIAAHSPEAVASLFDQYAGHFDKHLLDTLQYQTPVKLYHLAKPFLNEKTIDSILDLGCGTGLSIAPFVNISQERIGVDISSQMIAKAKEKNIYSQLFISEIEVFLKNQQRKYDLAICVDTLVYIRALHPIFTAVAKCLSRKGIFACSTERAKSGSSSLQHSGRYAHTPTHVKEAAKSAGLNLLNSENIVLRKDNEMDIRGDCWVFQLDQM